MQQLLVLLFIVAAPMAGAQSVWSDESPVQTNHTRIVVHKASQILEFHQRGRNPMIFRVCLGMNPEGPKKITGDQRTPEGEYFICLKSEASSFHRFLGISYPGERDAQAAFEQGMISLDTRDSILQPLREGRQPPWNTKLGGWVGIHGYPTDNYRKLWITLLYPKPHNWTDGCIALWDFEIDQIFPKVSLGTPVTILP
ncbi:MAG: L,D-transpeptidase family protein [Thermodesulfobacteriota bacterium]